MPALDPTPKVVKKWRPLDSEEVPASYKILRDGDGKIVVCDAPWLDPYWATQTINSSADLISTIIDLRKTWCIRIRGWNGGVPTGPPPAMPDTGTETIPHDGTPKGCWYGSGSGGVSSGQIYMGNTAKEYEINVGYDDGTTGPGEIALGATQWADKFYSSSGFTGFTPWYSPTDFIETMALWQNWYQTDGGVDFFIAVGIFCGEYANMYPPVCSPTFGREPGDDPIETSPGVVRYCIADTVLSAGINNPAWLTWERWPYGSVSIGDLISPAFGLSDASPPYMYGSFASGAIPVGGNAWTGNGCRPSSLTLDFF